MLAPPARRITTTHSPLAISPYEWSLATGTPLTLQHGPGTEISVDVGPWLRSADAADHSALALIDGPTLDIGCGPGRIVEALVQRGVRALGVDIAPTAVRLARERGVPVLHRDVFDTLPDEGRWTSAVLLDGNIGIGGDPSAVLHRARTLITARGSVLVETHRDDSVDECLSVRFVRERRPVGAAFPWALVGRRALERHAAAAGLEPTRTGCHGGRTFVVLRSVGRPTTALQEPRRTVAGTGRVG